MNVTRNLIFSIDMPNSLRNATNMNGAKILTVTKTASKKYDYKLFLTDI